VILPELCQIDSNESFGIVSSKNAMSFGGLFEIKQEDKDNFDLLDVIEMDNNTLPMP
jgi:hypothetical protein